MFVGIICIMMHILDVSVGVVHVVMMLNFEPGAQPEVRNSFVILVYNTFTASSMIKESCLGHLQSSWEKVT